MASNYVTNINQQETDPFLVSLRLYAKQYDVPIITYEGMQFLKQLLQLNKSKQVLELGSAIGYSAIALAKEGISVTTIERNQEMAKLAKENIRKAGVSSQVTLIEGDALLVDISDFDEVDALFIDAAKAQNINFFERYQHLVKPGGFIITDNLLFHGTILDDRSKLSRNLKQLTRKIDDFNQYVINKKGYDSVLYEIGDGMSVSIKKDDAK